MLKRLIFSALFLIGYCLLKNNTNTTPLLVAGGCLGISMYFLFNSFNKKN